MKKGESRSLTKSGKVIRCKSENHVPIVAVSKETRILDDPSKASADRLQTPGARLPGDRSRKAIQCPEPGKPGQASGDRLQSNEDDDTINMLFPGVRLFPKLITRVERKHSGT